ncbi:hypothetical protein [Mycolicibacterium goodii]|uniref:Methyl-accepting chemotaxis sensory transducer n=1 Tax=Mycolicibacterium goodii TaxID=134601 RepID=A0ABS6HUY5_MYCGD|nr:hypothetical protein [Mycolicibacterium goodii]MBU8826499.1 hypothetical protein [Mycolicibacterium goodii]
MAIGEFWPSISENDIQSVADEHRDAETRFSAYGDTLKRKMSTSPDLLQGQAGTARVERLTEMRNHAYDVADHLGSKAVTAESYKSTVLGLKLSLTQIGDAAQQAWETAQKTKTPFSAVTFKEEAATAFSTALGDIAAAPPPLPVPGNDGSATPVDHKSQKDEPTSEKEDTDVKESANAEDAADNDSGSGQTDKNNFEASPFDGSTSQIDGSGQSDAPITEAPSQSVADPGTAAMPPVLGTPTTGSPGMPTNLPTGGTPSAGVGAGSIRPPQVPSGLSALSGNPLKDAATAPASSMSEALSSNPVSSNPLSSAASSFQSGLASGMGASGAVSATPSPALEKFAAQHPSVTPVASPGQQAPVVPAQGAGAAAPAAPSGPAPVGGGGGMVPPVAAGGGGGLAPYVPPGGGGGPVPPPAAGTVPASAQPATPVGPTTQQGGGAGAPLVAGSGGAGAGAALTDSEPSADLLLARRVLDGLVRGTEVREDLLNGGFVQWAVSVVQLPSGPSVSIASSVGGGAYVPPGVFIPNSAHLAVFDELLPLNWATRFMGVEQPTALLAAHAEELSEHVAGARRSALVTTELGVARPVGWPDFESIRAVEILHTPGEAPSMGGGYVHRLMTVDRPAWAKVQAVLQQGLGLQAAGAITEAVLAAAAQTPSALAGMDGQESRLVEQYDVDHVLEPLRNRTAVDWDAHYRNVIERHNSAVLHPSMAGGVLDADDSEVSRASQQVYVHFYRAGLMIELLRCWRVQPPSLPDLVYCAKIAGFGHVVDAVLAPRPQTAGTPS